MTGTIPGAGLSWLEENMSSTGRISIYFFSILILMTKYLEKDSERDVLIFTISFFEIPDDRIPFLYFILIPIVYSPIVWKAFYPALIKSLSK